MLFRINKVENELASIREELASVVRSLKAYESLRTEVETLAERVAHLPTPIRSNWSRTAAPVWERKTMTLPSVRVVQSPRQVAARISRNLALLKHSPVEKVTICTSGHEQFVHAYDLDGHEIPRYCGPFHKVGLELLKVASHVRWEEVAESA